MFKKVFIVFILTASVSCSKQKIIPENVLAEIIYEMYITDAVLLTHESSIMRYKDSLKIYEPVVEKFGYSFDDLRRTFLKYTANDGKLQSVLKKVIKRIEAEKNIYKESARIEKLSENMNVGTDSISIVSRTINKQNIEVRLSEKGVYDISASYFFYKNDSTKNPKMVVWLESAAHKDSVMEKHEISLAKDTVFTDYLARVRFNDPKFNILKIYWLDFEQKPDSSKPAISTSLPAKPANTRTANQKKKLTVKIKPDTTTRQHLIIRRKSVKYNFEESDTTKLKENDEFVGPLLPDSLLKSKVTDSVTNVIDSVERIIAITRKDSINHEKE
ncbi:MAG: DUF4296 domain-containing protein [Prevotellaceae bacterium]|jgi:hypothetical protein|nr:DUF4296 domain-containing protein [Prevotellaceae bacterium]